MKGIKAVVGVLKEKGIRGGRTEVQSILIPISISLREARTWLKRHGFKISGIEEGREYWRVRQHDPGKYIRLRTIEFNPGAKWHEDEMRKAHRLYKRAKEVGVDPEYHEVWRDAHIQSASVLRRMGINPESEGEERELGHKVSAFVHEYGTAHGGNWSAMFMSAIRRGAPEVFEKMEDKSYDFKELYDIIEEIVRKKKNPGAAWHKKWGDAAARVMSSHKQTSHIRKYWKGVMDTHYDSEIAAEKLGMNPRKKWYIGVLRRTSPDYKEGKLFSSSSTPTESSHGDLFSYVIGPWRSEKEAFDQAKRKGFVIIR